MIVSGVTARVPKFTASAEWDKRNRATVAIINNIAGTVATVSGQSNPITLSVYNLVVGNVATVLVAAGPLDVTDIVNRLSSANTSYKQTVLRARPSALYILDSSTTDVLDSSGYNNDATLSFSPESIEFPIVAGTVGG